MPRGAVANLKSDISLALRQHTNREEALRSQSDRVRLYRIKEKFAIGHERPPMNLLPVIRSGKFVRGKHRPRRRVDDSFSTVPAVWDSVHSDPGCAATGVRAAALASASDGLCFGALTYP